MNKAAVVDALRASLHARLRTLASGGAAARAGTRVDAGHRPTNRGERAAVTTQGYLARGLGERALAVRQALDLLDEVDLSPTQTVRPGARVQVETADGPETYMVLPGGQGDVLAGVTVVSPGSPLGRALRDREAGDVVTVRRRGREVEVEVVAVT